MAWQSVLGASAVTAKVSVPPLFGVSAPATPGRPATRPMTSFDRVRMRSSAVIGPTSGERGFDRQSSHLGSLRQLEQIDGITTGKVIITHAKRQPQLTFIPAICGLSQLEELAGCRSHHKIHIGARRRRNLSLV